MRYYAGIGSRQTPKNILKDMTELASELEALDFWLRSGSADGADYAFERGVKQNAQIWLPWGSFNENKRNPNLTYKVIGASDREANLSVNKYHPNGMNLRDGVRKLQARNYRQIVGLNEPNSEFVVCWTKEGKDIGGTAQAIRIARDFSIPIYNMYNLTKEEILEIIKNEYN